MNSPAHREHYDVARAFAMVGAGNRLTIMRRLGIGTIGLGLPEHEAMKLGIERIKASGKAQEFIKLAAEEIGPLW